MLGKTELLEMLNGLNRGIVATSEQRTWVEAAVTRLEERNPTPTPTEAASLLDGDWRLLYTTSTELLGIDGWPLLQLGPVYQCIRVAQGQVFNLAEVEGIPYCEGLVSVGARFEATGPRRLTVHFERALFGLQRWVNYVSPAQFIPKIQSGESFAAIDFMIRDRQGWIDLTYLDADLRINRGNEGSLFILTKV